MTEEAAHTHASFFSGIGGFDLGLERAGFSTVAQVEIDEFCNRILETHWPDVQRFGDINQLEGTALPDADIWTGGFPCQDVSVARARPRDGLEGTKSGLFFEFARLVGECRPRVIIIENVTGLLSSHDGRDFGIVVRSLAELGYGVGWRVLNSKNFEVPQSRKRVFIVGCYRDRRGPAEILFDTERGSGDSETGRSSRKKSISPFKERVGDPSEGPVVQRLAYCLYATAARHTGTDWSRTYVPYPEDGEVRRLMPVECEGLQGFPRGWTIPHDADDETLDELDTPRYRALGNAVTVNVAEWLGEQVKPVLDRMKAQEEHDDLEYQDVKERADVAG